MKKIITVLAVFFTILLLNACGTSTGSEVEDIGTVTYNNIAVNMSVREDGFYSLLSNVEIHYYDGDIRYISMDDPTLLAFQVSSANKGGVWLLNLEDGQAIIDELTDVSETLRAQGDSNLAERTEDLIEIISRSGPYTSAST